MGLRLSGRAMASRRTWGAALLLGAGLGVAWLVLAVRPVLVPFALALVLAYLLAPAVAVLQARGMSRSCAIMSVYAALAAAGTAVAMWAAPAASRELQQLLRGVPDGVGALRGHLDALEARLRQPGVPDGVRQGALGFLAELEARADRLVGATAAGIAGLAEWLLYLALAPVLAYYLLRDLPQFHRAAVHAVPRRWRPHAVQLLHELDRVLAGFIRGELLLALAVGALAALATWLLRLPYSLLLGAWAALCELVPYVGPVAGAAPATLLALSISPVRALQVALAFAVIQQLESAVLGPHVMGASVGLHPLTVLFAILAGGYLAGVWGMLLAVPVAGILRVVWGFAVRGLSSPPGSPPEGGGNRA